MRGRKAKADRPVEWKISVPESVVAPVSLLLSDPLTGRPAHGARSQLVTRLLREWLMQQQFGNQDENTNPNVFPGEAS